MTTRDTRVEPGPIPLGNPLVGLVPYAAPPKDRFPHAMEFRYFALSDLMAGPDEFRWEALEGFLEDVRRRGNQSIFRVWMQYPGKPSGIPPFLVRDGLKVHRWTNTNTAPFPPAEVVTPDYSDRRLRKALVSFIMALGARYDGDPRIGYVTAGLLGTWGEWHDYPRTDLWASHAVQDEVMAAYRGAMRRTPVLLRTPAGKGDPHYAPTTGQGFGYHDDSFCWATLETGREADSWFFEPRLKAAGEAEAWRHRPIGGEIRPEAWGIVFDDDAPAAPIQPFGRCEQRLHATWLMDTGMFREPPDQRRVSRASDAVRRMGFAPRVLAVSFGAEPAGRGQTGLQLEVSWTNVGNAPHYYGWSAEARILGSSGRPVAIFPERPPLGPVLPGETARWRFRTVVSGAIPDGRERLRVQLRVPNPMSGGKPLRFANRGAELDGAGWLEVVV